MTSYSCLTVTAAVLFGFRDINDIRYSDSRTFWRLLMAYAVTLTEVRLPVLGFPISVI